MTRGGARGERGAAALIIGLLMSVVLLVSAAFAVDLGMQRVVRRDMQAVADLAALDLARLLEGKTVGDYSAAEFNTALAESLARNDDNAGADVGVTGCGALPTADAGACWEFVVRDDAAGEWTTVTDAGATPEAVRVRARSTVGFAFGGITDVGEGSATRSAVATNADPIVCVSVGTKLLTLDTAGSALSPLLDGILRVNLSAIGYEGIATLKDTTVPLADLMLELGVGTYDELATTNVSLAGFTAAAADVLRANGNTADAEVLEALQLGVPGLPITIGDLLALETGTPVAGVDAEINVLDILSAAVMIANGDHAVELGIPGVASVTIIEKPQPACGKKTVTASSAQIRVELSPSLSLAPPLLAGNVNVTLNVGNGEATIKSLGCGPKRAVLDVTTSGATLAGKVSLAVTTSHILSTLGLINRLLIAPIFTLLGLNKVEVEATVSGTVLEAGPVERTIVFPEPPALPPTLVEPDGGIDKALTVGVGAPVIGNNGGLLGELGAALTGLVSGIVMPLVTPVVSSVSGILTPIVNALIDVLGLRLGVAEVSVSGNPGCSGVRLVG